MKNDCSKRKFDTKEKARNRLDEINKQGNIHSLINVYFCKKCSYWHLTSKTKKQYIRNIKNKRIAIQRLRMDVIYKDFLNEKRLLNKESRNKIKLKKIANRQFR